jgi:hypothetical protein
MAHCNTPCHWQYAASAPLILAACPFIAHPTCTRYLPRAARCPPPDPTPHVLALHRPRARPPPSTCSILTIHAHNPHHPHAPSLLPAHLFSVHVLRPSPLFCTLLGPGHLSSSFSIFPPTARPLHLFRAVEKTTRRICTHVNASSCNENTLYYHCIC